MKRPEVVVQSPLSKPTDNKFIVFWFFFTVFPTCDHRKSGERGAMITF